MKRFWFAVLFVFILFAFIGCVKQEVSNVDNRITIKTWVGSKYDMKYGKSITMTPASAVDQNVLNWHRRNEMNLAKEFLKMKRQNPWKKGKQTKQQPKAEGVICK